MNQMLILIGLFILGTIFGSLGSVLITRLGDGVNKDILKGIFFGFSHCPKCKHRLHTRNLVPLASFFLQKGRCLYCHEPIALMYPIIELASGLVFALTYLWIGNFGIGILIFWLMTNRLLLLLIVHDFIRYELHMPLWIVALLWVLDGQFLFPLGNYAWAFYSSLIFGAIFAGIYFFAKRYVKMKYHKDMQGFGEGDIYMGFLLGTLVPFVIAYHKLDFSIGTVLLLLLLLMIVSSILGLCFAGIGWLGKEYYKMYHTHHALRVIPFIPFMVLGFWVLLVWGKFFINLVLR